MNVSAVATLYKIMNKTTEVGAGDGMIHQSKTNENANRWTKGVCCYIIERYGTLHTHLTLPSK